jgi:hypothetical protein
MSLLEKDPQNRIPLLRRASLVVAEFKQILYGKETIVYIRKSFRRLTAI